TPVRRDGYRIGVPATATQASPVWQEILNSDAAVYGGIGAGAGNGERIAAQPQPSHGHPQSLVLTLPPLSTILLKKADHP
ncbi:MAG: 1,4-alpha-glucan branching enzyme, partial [Xanthomonas sp.]|nr:1,4-alpha-glucan branching enzyme [Xanthomonas sp.]